MGYTVAVIGATGNVGRELLSILAEREFPVEEVIALASSRSIGREVSFGEDDVLKVENLDEFDFTGVDIVLSSPGASVSSKYAPIAAEAGAVVIDNTSYFRMDPDVPLVVPEVNPGAISDFKKRGIIANPNCSTIQLVVALKPLHELAKIKRVVVSTYQSVSGAGKSGMDELFNQTRGIFVNEPTESHRENFTKQMAFNCIPHIDKFMDDGSTKEEWKMAVETKKILDPEIELVAHCVRIPVFIGQIVAAMPTVNGEAYDLGSVHRSGHFLDQSVKIGEFLHGVFRLLIGLALLGFRLLLGLLRWLHTDGSSPLLPKNAFLAVSEVQEFGAASVDCSCLSTLSTLGQEKVELAVVLGAAQDRYGPSPIHEFARSSSGIAHVGAVPIRLRFRVSTWLGCVVHDHPDHACFVRYRVEQLAQKPRANVLP